MYSLFCIDGHCCVESRRRERYDFDTIRSLHLAPCALYVGTVKRENIGFDITAMTIEEGKPTIRPSNVLLPPGWRIFWTGIRLSLLSFAGGIDMKLKTWVYPANWHWVASYYGKRIKSKKPKLYKLLRRVKKNNRCYESFRYGGGYQRH